jgi:exopolysaccharide biosynthesis protein
LITAKEQFKTADPKQWIIFSHPWQDRIYPVLAGRIAYVAYVKGKKAIGTSGFRSDEEQLKSQKDTLAEHPDYTQGPDGRVYDTKGRCVVSAVGQSSHNWGYAFDSFGTWLEKMSDSELRRYGLRKPMAYEPWHIECVEKLTLEQKKANFYKYMEEYPMDIKTFQMITGLKPDGIAGPLTKAKAEEVEKVCKLILDTPYPPVAVKPKFTHEVIGITHVVKLNPMDLRAKLVKASGKTLAKSERSFINCNLFNSNMSIIGWLISEGKILSRRDEYKTWKGNPKGTLIVYRDGTVFAGLKLDSEIVKELDRIWFCTQGFNLFPVDLKKEGFNADIGRKTDRMAIGFNGKDIIITYRPDSDAARAVQTMKNLNCKMAICLDSGLSSNMVLDGKSIITSSRTLPCIITF